MRIQRWIGLAGAGVLVLGGVASGQQAPASSGQVRTPGDADQALPPGLKVGDKAPEAEMLDASGNPVSLASMYGNGTVIVTFYRGGWCPYCNKALAGWQERMEDLKGSGATLIAITPEQPEGISETDEKLELDFTILCDAKMQAAERFKLAFTMDDATREKYGKYGIDLAETNESAAWRLPAPATFVIDRDGVVRWVFADWDYSKRASVDDVLEAVASIPH